MTQLTSSKDYSSTRRLNVHSALGEYSQPTISSHNKARSRSSSQKSRLIRRPSSRYGTTTTAPETRETNEINYPRCVYDCLVFPCDELKRGLFVSLENEQQSVKMRLHVDYMDIDVNSVNQTLTIPPFPSSLRTIKLVFVHYSTLPFSIKVRSLEGKINPSHVLTSNNRQESGQIKVIDPFLMMEEAEYLRKKMLLRLTAKKTSNPSSGKKPGPNVHEERQEEKEYQIHRKSSLRTGFPLGLKYNIFDQSRLELRREQAEKKIVPVLSDLKTISVKTLKKGQQQNLPPKPTSRKPGKQNYGQIFPPRPPTQDPSMLISQAKYTKR